jgi:hypothetical protein
MKISTDSRNISDPRALAIVLEQAEKRLADELHPDPYRGEFCLRLWERGCMNIDNSADRTRRNKMVSRRSVLRLLCSTLPIPPQFYVVHHTALIPPCAVLRKVPC